MNAVLDAIALRRSIRAFTDRQVTDEELSELISAAQEAPSAMNKQPYHFTFVRNKELLKEFSDDFNRTSTRSDDRDYDVLHGAPLVCFIFSDNEGFFPPIDSGIAVENLALAAYSLGLGSVILGLPVAVFGATGNKWLKKLDAPENMHFTIAIGIGTPAAGKDAHPVREGLVSIL